jgi:hypothetical protein
MITNDSFHWRKSSYSGGGGNACVEFGIQWRKSSYSGGDPNECVEIACSLGAIRDSKNPTGPVLHTDLADLLAAVKKGTFDN